MSCEYMPAFEFISRCFSLIEDKALSRKCILVASSQLYDRPQIVLTKQNFDFNFRILEINEMINIFASMEDDCGYCWKASMVISKMNYGLLGGWIEEQPVYHDILAMQSMTMFKLMTTDTYKLTTKI